MLDGGGAWSGRASELIVASADYDFGLTYDAKSIGGFLSKNIGLFKAIDGIHVERVSNGTGSKYYRITKNTVDTVDNR